MKLPHPRKDDTRATTIAQALWLIMTCSVFLAMTARAANPSWWSSRNAVNTSLGANDYGVVNQGQLKQFTARAVDEMNANLSGGAGTNLNTMMTNWANEYSTNGYCATNREPSDYQAMTVGQLKYVGKKVWSQLVSAGYTGSLPSWLSTTNSNYDVANIGQLKTVFNFSLITDLTVDFNNEVDNRLATAAPYTSVGNPAYAYNNSLPTTVPASVAIFSTVNDTTGTYTRNPNIWTGTLDLSGVPAKTSWDNGPYNGGALVTPTDLICANHYGYATPAPSATLIFVDNSNVCYTATVASATEIGTTDIRVEHLTWSGSTPTTLKIYPVLPSNYQSYSSTGALNNFPVICTNQFRQILVQDSTSGFIFGNFWHDVATEANRSPYSWDLVTGDSGQPVFCVVNGQLVLLGTNYGATGFPPVSNNISAINTALASLSSSYSLTTVDLSGFTSY